MFHSSGCTLEVQITSQMNWVLCSAVTHFATVTDLRAHSHTLFFEFSLKPYGCTILNGWFRYYFGVLRQPFVVRT